MKQISIIELREHPRNKDFFDDFTGERWEDFKKSIRTSGVIEPIRITQDNVIVSGHQRVKACKELGIVAVPYTQHTYSSEDLVLKDLIEANIQQRGVGNTNPVKFGKCIKELERIYGIHQGNGSNQHEQNPKRSDNAKTPQEQLAAQIGISVDTLHNFKLLSEMIPELEELLDTGIVTKTTALAIVKNLSPSEQEEFISSMDITKKITKKEAEKYIENIRSESKEEISRLEDMLEAKEVSNKSKSEELQNKIRSLDKDKKMLEVKLSQLQSDNAEYAQLKENIENLKKQKNQIRYSIDVITELAGLCVEIQDMLEKKLAPIKFKKSIEVLNEEPVAKKNLESIVNKVDEWVYEMKKLINDNIVETID